MVEMEEVKEFYKNYVTFSLSEKLERLKSLKLVVMREALPVEAVKCLTHKFGQNLMNSDRKEKQHVLDVLNSLLTKYYDVSSKVMLNILNTLHFKTITGRRSQAKLALKALEWVYLLVKAGEVSMTLLEIMSTLLASISNTSSVMTLRQKAQKDIFNLFSSNPALPGHCLELILGSSGYSLHVMVLLNLIVAYFTKHETKHNLPSQQYLKILRRFTELVLGSRICPDQYIVDNCADIFKPVTHQLFKEYLLQPMLKALLRNPDELTQTVCFVISSVPIDLSPYAEELCKNAVPLLYSQHSETRHAAQSLLSALAKQCSDAASVKTCSNLLLTALKSSPVGKLAVAEHRCNVLVALKSLTLCPLSSSGQREVASLVVQSLISHVKQEVHARTAIAAVNVLRAWCPLLPENHTEIVEFIKTALTNKTTPPLLRAAYLFCVLALHQEEGHLTLYPLILLSLERLSAPSPQPAILEEAIVIIHVLIKYSRPDPIPSQVWSVADSYSEQLVSKKLVSTASQECLQVLVQVAKALLCSDDCKLKETKTRDWLSGLVHVLLQSPWETRKVAAKCISEVVYARPILAECILQELVGAAKIGEFPPKQLLLAMVSLVTPTHFKKETLAIGCLLLSHHPSIAAVAPGAWMAILKRLQLNPYSFISSSSSLLTSTIVSGMVVQPQACRLALSTLLTFGAAPIAAVLVEEVCKLLRRQELVDATEEHLEILRTPQGQLWHNGLRKELEAASSGGPVTMANMKRESRAYSFEDQKWEMEIRQELLQRKVDSDETSKNDVQELLKKTKLTQKQKQAIETQLAHEESTRLQLSELTEQLGHLVKLVETLKGEILLPHIPQLCHVTRNALGSPLARPYCRRMWGLMVHSVFQEWTLAQLFAETCFCTLTSGTTPPALPRVFLLLKGDIPISLDVNSASYTLMLPILQHVIMSHDNKDISHDVKESAVHVLSNAVNKYISGVKDEEVCFNHELFPAAETLSLLCAVVATGDESIKMTKIKKLCVSMFISLLPTVYEQSLSLVTSSLFHESSLLRNMVLQGLSAIPPSALPTDPPLLVGIFIAQHDQDQTNRSIATNLWDVTGFSNSLTSELSTLIIEHCSSNNLVIQSPAALALGVWLKKYPNQTTEILDLLITTYNAKRTTPPSSKDSFGREIVVDYRDQWECRVGVAKALEQITKSAGSNDAMKFLKFVIPHALSDPSPKVRSAMICAAQTAISSHGDELADELMAHSENSLKTILDTLEADVVRQSIIVLMGTLAKHMDKDSAKVKAVVHLLLSNLDTPSQQVQEAIAGCLSPLASVIKPDAEEIIKKLLEKLLGSTSYSQRKGAAYGLAGLIKGLGIPTLKQYQVMATLQDAIKNKKNYHHREGALFAFQSLCNMLGRLFEPYVVHLLPDLLVCFGDGNQYVREATDQTARTIMSHLSNHGVKLILPSLLSALEEESWRTKAGSAELLGAMAFCAPKQLSSCLPSIVPRLMDVLADSHSKVQAAGSQALKQIGSVIKNPEIQELVPILLESLSDPSNQAQACLQALLETEFVHVIDPPSLALIMPTLKRTLDVRSTDTKKKAAQIIGNMYSLTDKKDLAPYLNDVLPGLKQSLVDPVPEVRTVCAKALGAIARGMGDEGLEKLLPWLMATLQSEGTSVDRSGGAQGLSEVLSSQGVDYLKDLLPKFIDSCQNLNNPPHIRDGYFMLFIYLPMTFGNQFTEFIGDLLPPILKGLADESEFVRETALQAGQTIVNRYADTAVKLFLPQLERGLFDENWRIRCSSIQLLGDLLYKISGLSGKMSTESEEDDNFGTEAAHQMLLRSLGKECRDRVLAGLYMGRSDVALIVRQTSLHVWKVVVTNTARTLREILPTLVHLLLGCLASQSTDKRKVAARTLGDLVRKLGERVLPEVIPMLKQGMESETPLERQGVCIGLSEIIQQTSRDNVLQYMDSLLPTVQSALCDQESEVRAAAAMTFDSLHSTIGPRVLDEVLSPLLTDLSSPSSEHLEVVLDGLKQVMAVKSRVVLPHIVPQLIQPPVNIRALALLTSAAGEALNKHLNRIIPALINALEGSHDEEMWQSAEEVVLSVQKDPGPSILIEELIKCCQVNRPEVRGVAMYLLHILCSKSTASLAENLPHLMIFTTESLNDPSDFVCEHAWLALDAVVKRVNQKELPQYAGYLRKALRTVSANLTGDELHGFGLKGITPALTLLKEGLISGSPDEKEEAARVLVEVIHLTSSKTLSMGKVVMLIAGPLIRVLGDRYGWNVKVATLEALVELVRKVGGAAKAFIPQLQTSYLKALNDPNRPVRVQAITGLIELFPLSPRVDPVFNDLHNGIKKNEDPGLRLTMLQALLGVIKAGGKKMSEKHREEILVTLIALQATAHEGHRLEAAQCVGAMCGYMNDTQLQNTLATHILDQDRVTDWAVLQARATTISWALLFASSRISSLGLKDVVAKCIMNLASSDRVPVCESGLWSVGSFLNHMEGDGEIMIPFLCQGLTHSSTDVKITACNVCADLLSPPDKVLVAILPHLLQSTKEKNTALKASAEEALYKLIHGDTHLKYITSLLDVNTSRRLEDTYSKIQGRHLNKD